MELKIDGPAMDEIQTYDLENAEINGIKYDFIQGAMQPEDLKGWNTIWAKLLVDSGLLQEFAKKLADIWAIAAADKRMDQHRAPFHNVDNRGEYEIRADVRGVGHWLNDRGGLGLMQFALHTLGEGSQFAPGDSRQLEYAWSGIGEWEA